MVGSIPAKYKTIVYASLVRGGGIAPCAPGGSMPSKEHILVQHIFYKYYLSLSLMMMRPLRVMYALHSGHTFMVNDQI